MRFGKYFQLLASLAAVLASGPSPAAGTNLLGFDDMSCGQWIHSKDDPDLRSSYVVWVRGFLSGHNYALPAQQVATFSSGTLELKVNQYCARNPGGSFGDAAMRLSDELSGRNKPIRK